MFIFSNQRFLVIKLFYSSAIVCYYPRAKLNIIFELQIHSMEKSIAITSSSKTNSYFSTLCYIFFISIKNIFWYNLNFYIIDFILQTVSSGGRSVSIEEYPIRQERVSQKKNVGECYIFLFRCCRKG